MLISVEHNNHFVLLPNNVSKDKFLLQAKVRKGSYFYKRLENIYIALTSITTDLEEEYKTYYDEYKNFEDYLFHKYPLFDIESLRLITSYLQTGKYKLLKGYMYELSDYNLHMLLSYSEDFTEKINNLLKADLYED